MERTVEELKQRAGGKKKVIQFAMQSRIDRRTDVVKDVRSGICSMTEIRGNVMLEYKNVARRKGRGGTRQ